VVADSASVAFRGTVMTQVGQVRANPFIGGGFAHAPDGATTSMVAGAEHGRLERLFCARHCAPGPQIPPGRGDG
jgi:hypothetical protein